MAVKFPKKSGITTTKEELKRTPLYFPSAQTVEQVSQIATVEERLENIIERTQEGVHRTLEVEELEQQVIDTGQARQGYCHWYNRHITRPNKFKACRLGDECPYLHEPYPQGYNANKISKICRLFGMKKKQLLDILVSHGLIEKPEDHLAKKISSKVIMDVVSYYRVAVTPIKPTSHYCRIAAPASSSSSSSTQPIENSNPYLSSSSSSSTQPVEDSNPYLSSIPEEDSNPYLSSSSSSVTKGRSSSSSVIKDRPSSKKY